jgi:hypothetical protein
MKERTFLVRKKGRYLDYIVVPRQAKLVKSKSGYRAKIGNTLGVLFSDYKVVKAMNTKEAFKKVYGLDLQ